MKINLFSNNILYDTLGNDTPDVYNGINDYNDDKNYYHDNITTMIIMIMIMITNMIIIIGIIQ